MRLKQNQIENFITNPDPLCHVILIHGNSPDQIRRITKTLISRLGGESLNQEMRLVNFNETEILNDKEKLIHELQIKSFFNGPKIILIENVSDRSQKFVKEVLLQNLTNSETLLLLIGSNLSTKSSLRKLIEDQASFAASIGVYAKDLSTFEIKNMIDNRGLKIIDEESLSFLKEIAAESDSSHLIHTLDKLELAFLGDERPLNREDIESVVVEDIVQNYFLIVENVAMGNISKTIKEFRNYAIGQQNFSSLLAFLSRYFKNMQNIRSKVDTRVPYFGKAKEKFENHLKLWPKGKIEKVINLIFDTNIELREKSAIKHSVKMERMLMNICSLIK